MGVKGGLSTAMYSKSSLVEFKRYRSRPQDIISSISKTFQFICSRIPRLLAITALFLLILATLYRLSWIILTKPTARNPFGSVIYNDLLIPFNIAIPKKIWQLRFNQSKLDVPQVTVDELLDEEDRTFLVNTRLRETKVKELSAVKTDVRGSDKKAGYVKADKVNHEAAQATKILKVASVLKTEMATMHTSTTMLKTDAKNNGGNNVQQKKKFGDGQARHSTLKGQDRLLLLDISTDEASGVKETQFSKTQVSEPEIGEEAPLEDPEQTEIYAYDREDEVSDSFEPSEYENEPQYDKSKDNQIHTFSRVLEFESLEPKKKQNNHRNSPVKMEKTERVTEVAVKVPPTASSKTNHSRPKDLADHPSARYDVAKHAGVRKPRPKESAAGSPQKPERLSKGEAKKSRLNTGLVTDQDKNFPPIDKTIVKAKNEEPAHQGIPTLSSHVVNGSPSETTNIKRLAGFQRYKERSKHKISQVLDKRNTYLDTIQAPLPSVIASNSLYSTMVTNPDFSHTLLSVLGSHAFAEHYLSQKYPDLLSVYISLRTLRLKAEITRFLVLAVSGGYWVDLDTITRRTFDELIPYEWRNSVGCIVGVEYDQGEDTELQTGTERKVQFARWMLAARPNHPLMEKMVLGALKDVRRLATEKSMSVWEMELSDAEIENLVGAGKWADEVMEFIRKAERGDLELSGMKEPRLFGDVLVLPVDVLGAWQAWRKEPDEVKNIRSVVRRYREGVKF